MTWVVGIATGCCIERPIVEALQSAARAGVREIEIGTPPRHFDPLAPAAVDEVEVWLERLGLHARSIHAPFGGPHDLSNPDERARRDAVATMCRVARVLARLGGETMVVHPSDTARHEADPAVRLRAAAEGLRALAASCRDEGVTLAVETPLPHLIGGHPDEFSALLAELDSGVGVCLDTGHVHLGHHLQAMLAVAGPRLVHVHAHDNRGRHDDHLIPGAGTIRWDDVFAGLEGARYRGPLILELHCPSSGRCSHYAEAAARMRDLMKRA